MVMATTPECDYIGGHESGFDRECYWCVTKAKQIDDSLKGKVMAKTKTKKHIKMPWDGPIHLARLSNGKPTLRGSREHAEDMFGKELVAEVLDGP